MLNIFEQQQIPLYEQNLLRDRSRRKKRRFIHEGSSATKIRASEQEMSLHFDNLTLDTSHLISSSQLIPTQAYAQTPNYPTVLAMSVALPSSDEFSEDDFEKETQSSGILMDEDLKHAMSRTTEILPRDVIKSILSTSSLESSCTAVAIWKPVDVLLHLAEPASTEEVEAAASPASDASGMSEDESMET